MEISSPANNSTINNGKVDIKNKAESAEGIAKVIVSIDGDVVATLTEAPYNTSVKQNFADGTHTISARAVDKLGISNDTSITFKVGESDEVLELTEPNNNSTVDFPLTLSASSSIQFDNVSFYYQTGSTSKLIGTAGANGNLGSPYSYSITWNSKPAPGKYKLYVRSNEGDTSAKIDVTIQ